MVIDMKLKFVGGVRKVTGSCHLIEVNDRRILLDCGMEMDGNGDSRPQIPFKAKDIDHIVLSHAHVDHSGLIPLLVSEGFDGKIWSTVATREVAAILLRDSAKLQKKAYEKNGRLPLYSENDVTDTIMKFSVREYGTPVELTDDITLTFSDAGHIIGSAICELIVEGSGKMVYTGDLGHGRSQIMNPPSIVGDINYLLIESTYGDRDHPQSSPKDELQRIVSETCNNKGKVLIPVFAVGRTQEILYLLATLLKEGKLPNIPVYLDGPMARDVTTIYQTCLDHLRPEFRNLFLRGESPFKFSTLEYINTENQSLDIANSSEPCVILGSGGMLKGGRVLNHLPGILEESRSSLVFVGYQAEGTLGRELIDGNKNVKIDENTVEVKSQILSIQGLSAHADKSSLIRYLDSMKILPERTYVVHGEETASTMFAKEIMTRFRIHTVVPSSMEEHVIGVGMSGLVRKPDIQIDFTPSFSEIAGVPVQVFTGALVKKEDGLHLVSKEQLTPLLNEEYEIVRKRETLAVPVLPEDMSQYDIKEEMFAAKVKEFCKSDNAKRRLSKGKIREYLDLLRKEGKNSVIGRINIDIKKERINRAIGELLIAGFNSLNPTILTKTLLPYLN